MDTGDTSNSEDTGTKQCQLEIVSAAKLAGETGGISCSTFGLISPMLLILSLIFIVFRRQP